MTPFFFSFDLSLKASNFEISAANNWLFQMIPCTIFLFLKLEIQYKLLLWDWTIDHNGFHWKTISSILTQCPHNFRPKCDPSPNDPIFFQYFSHSMPLGGKIGAQWRNRWGAYREKRVARKIEHKKRKIEKGNVNRKRECGKLKMERGEDLFFFFFCFFFFFFFFLLFTFQNEWNLFWVYQTTKMGIFYWEKAFHAGKKIRKNDFAPSEKYACYDPVSALHYIDFIYECPPLMT